MNLNRLHIKCPVNRLDSIRTQYMSKSNFLYKNRLTRVYKFIHYILRFFHCLTCVFASVSVSLMNCFQCIANQNDGNCIYFFSQYIVIDGTEHLILLKQNKQNIIHTMCFDLSKRQQIVSNLRQFFQADKHLVTLSRIHQWNQFIYIH